MKIYLAVNRQKDQLLEFTGKLAEYIRSHGAEVEIPDCFSDDFGNFHFDFQNVHTGAEKCSGSRCFPGKTFNCEIIHK